MKRRRQRDLTGAERNLWNTVARTVAPLPERAMPELTAHKEPDLALSPRLKPKPAKQDLRTALPAVSPLIGGDPRREKLVARGRLHIDGVLDLHGMRQVEADRATSAFLGRAIAQGHRVLLIITGKGSKDGTQGRGVLRKRFLQAMDGGLYGSRVSSVKPAHQRHGGDGAFYVFLKAPKRR